MRIERELDRLVILAAEKVKDRKLSGFRVQVPEARGTRLGRSSGYIHMVAHAPPQPRFPYNISVLTFQFFSADSLLH